MRHIILDTETTGLSPRHGHKIIEIGCVELYNYVPTGRTYHQYINPLRDVPQEAFAVHGISTEFLLDKPLFKDVVHDFLKFLEDDYKLVIHNAGFDMSFINFELEQHGLPPITNEYVIDTLAMARAKFPGAKNSLDALCTRYKVDNSDRELHGALLDAQILSKVYIHLSGGVQAGFAFDKIEKKETVSAEQPKKERKLRKFAPSAAELTLHKEFVGEIENALWFED